MVSAEVPLASNGRVVADRSERRRRRSNRMAARSDLGDTRPDLVRRVGPSLGRQTLDDRGSDDLHGAVTRELVTESDHGGDVVRRQVVANEALDVGFGE